MDAVTERRVVIDAPRVLIVTTDTADADAVRKLVAPACSAVEISITEADVSDFDRLRPNVVILAYRTIEQCASYTQRLGAISGLAIANPYRSVLLCSDTEAEQAYALCSASTFDDYVVFWPEPTDTKRILMVLHQAQALLDRRASNSLLIAEMAAHGDRIHQLEAELDQLSNEGSALLDATSETVASARESVSAELSALGNSLASGSASPDAVAAPQAAADGEFAKIDSTIAPLRDWTEAFPERVADHLEALREADPPPHLRKQSVLIVDDDSFQLKLIGGLLKDLDLEVAYANSSAQALSMLRSREPALVLLDVDMPVINGIETLAHIKSVERFADIPVMMITGHREKAIVKQCIQGGAAGYVVKPIDKDSFLEKVRSVLPVAEG